MTTATRLTSGGTVVLDGTGYGIVRLSPRGEKWEVTHTFVRCSTAVSEARCLVYLGTVAPHNMVDGTYSGSSGDPCNSHYYLEDGQAMIVEWTGGDAGATATVTVTGWRSTPEGGFRAVH